MSKKKLKKRIKELEVENMMLRVMALHPVYIYLYSGLPYRHYWQPYQWHPIGPITCEPNWVGGDASYTWVVPDSATYVSGTTNVGIDYSAGQDRTVVSTCAVSH